MCKDKFNTQIKIYDGESYSFYNPTKHIETTIVFDSYVILKRFVSTLTELLGRYQTINSKRNSTVLLHTNYGCIGSSNKYHSTMCGAEAMQIIEKTYNDVLQEFTNKEQ